MSASSALASDASEDSAVASARHDVEEAMSIADVSAALVVSSERVAADLALTSDEIGETPFIWTPTPRR